MEKYDLTIKFEHKTTKILNITKKFGTGCVVFQLQHVHCVDVFFRIYHISCNSTFNGVRDKFNNFVIALMKNFAFLNTALYVGCIKLNESK